MRKKIHPNPPLLLGDLCVLVRDIILVVIEVYIVRSELSENAFRLMRASNTDSRREGRKKEVVAHSINSTVILFDS